MNRNTESRFALAPSSLDVPRSQFDRSSGIKFSGNVGELIPFYVDEVLPGDTFKISTAKVVRLQTLLHPIMDNMYMDTYWFFVPNRIIWKHWKNFMGESAKAWRPQVEYRVPKINIDTDHPHPGVGSLMDYMGIPLNIMTSTLSGNPKAGINALPFRAYAKICTDWFRAETLQDELVIPDDDADVFVNSKSASDLYCAYGGPVYRAAKYHDYFTSCLPMPQCGPYVKIPTARVDGLAPVGTTTNAISSFPAFGSTSLRGRILGSGDLARDYYSVFGVKESSSWDARTVYLAGAGMDEPGVTSSGFVPSNLWADMSAGIGTINELRTAFQVQKFYEKLNYGRRYIEVLKSMFGVTSPDARLQRPEYLGGNRIPINVSEVTNNSASDSATLGDLGAMSRTSDSHDDFVHSFVEHGFLIGLCVIRYDHSYPQGLERFWQRTNMLDYYFPVFANIGNQPVYKSEINFSSSMTAAGDFVFGYQEYAADYRYKPSRVAGEMRPEAPNSLASWHLADYYNQQGAGPFLSDSWIREDKSNVDRTLAVSSSVSNQFFADFWIRNICTRVMPMYSIPGLADHH